MSIQAVKFFLILLLVSISAEDVAVAVPIAMTDALKSAISTNPSPQNINALITANPTLAVAITSAAITKAPESAAEITAAAVTAAPDSAKAITKAIFLCDNEEVGQAFKGVCRSCAANATIVAAAIKANASLAVAITAAALDATPPGCESAITDAALIALNEASLTATIPISTSSENTIANQQLQLQNFRASLTVCGGGTACIGQKVAIMATQSSATAAQIKAVVNEVVSPNGP